jgi:hypothetical protein
MSGSARMLRRAGIGLALAATLGGCSTIPVLRDGQPLLPVIVATDATGPEQAAATEFGQVLGKMSGLAWPVRPAAYAGEHGFYVGANKASFPGSLRMKPAGDLLAPKPGESGPDDFRIRSQDGSVFIAGATPEATRFAVDWFLQNQAGVRWYAPGAAGEVIPRRSQWSLPRLRIEQSPAYVSREIYGRDTAQGTEWARHNGLQSRLEFNHALAGVFPPEVLAAHPTWAPRLQGQRYLPLSAADANWQPNLASPEVAAHAARSAGAAFAAEPARASFSLGINDTVRFDQSAATRALVEPLHYFRGFPDYSPLVFAFMNRAAEAGALTGSGHYLGCLAYFWCENPPGFPVNPAVVPYVTTDRSQYYDSSYRAADLALMSRWRASGVKAYGLWEYAYGQGFWVPRLPHRALAAAIKEGWHRGARGYMADAGSHWGFDTFKTWLIAQLLWDPGRPFDELADDFFRGYYGPAAEPMRRFYDRCEAQWMAQPGPPYWLKFYQQEDQAGLFPIKTCRELRALLVAAAQAATGNPPVADRVEQTSRGFAVTETYVAFDSVRRKLTAMTDAEISNLSQAEAVLAESTGALLRARAQLNLALAAARTGEIPAISGEEAGFFVRNDPVPRLLWLAGQRDALAPGRILAAAGEAAMAEQRWAALAELFASGSAAKAEGLALNPMFAESAQTGQEPVFLYPRSGALPADWIVDAMPTETGEVFLKDGGTATRILRIEGAWDTQVFQWHRVGPGHVFVATASLRGNCAPGSDAGLFLTFLTQDGRIAGTHRMQTLPKGSTPDWRSLALADVAPENAAWVGLGIGASRQVAGDWLEVRAVQLRSAGEAHRP